MSQSPNGGGGRSAPSQPNNPVAAAESFVQFLSERRLLRFHTDLVSQGVDSTVRFMFTGEEPLLIFLRTCGANLGELAEVRAVFHKGDPPTPTPRLNVADVQMLERLRAHSAQRRTVAAPVVPNRPRYIATFDMRNQPISVTSVPSPQAPAASTFPVGIGPPSHLSASSLPAVAGNPVIKIEVDDQGPVQNSASAAAGGNAKKKKRKAPKVVLQVPLVALAKLPEVPLEPCDDCGDKECYFAKKKQKDKRKELRRTLYKCPTCGRPFARRDYLRRHMFDHLPSSKRRYNCNQCDAVYARAAALWRHREKCEAMRGRKSSAQQSNASSSGRRSNSVPRPRRRMSTSTYSFYSPAPSKKEKKSKRTYAFEIPAVPATGSSTEAPPASSPSSTSSAMSASSTTSSTSSLSVSSRPSTATATTRRGNSEPRFARESALDRHALVSPPVSSNPLGQERQSSSVSQGSDTSPSQQASASSSQGASSLPPLQTGEASQNSAGAMADDQESWSYSTTDQNGTNGTEDRLMMSESWLNDGRQGGNTSWPNDFEVSNGMFPADHDMGTNSSPPTDGSAQLPGLVAGVVAADAAASDGNGSRRSCKMCNATFPSLQELLSHSATHAYDPRRKHACDKCGKRFPLPSHLRRHMLTHTKEKPFKCEVCGRGMTTKQALFSHKLTHTADKPEVCRTCGKSFQTKCKLRRHQMVHDAARPYECVLCPQAFAYARQLRLHVAKVHKKVRSYVCDQCGKTFKTSTHLTSHVARAHTAPEDYAHECDVCRKKFPTKSGLLQHKVTHAKLEA